jgi:hypothetical protein
MEASTSDLPQQQRQPQEPPSTVVGRGGSDAKNEIVFQVEVIKRRHFSSKHYCLRIFLQTVLFF